MNKAITAILVILLLCSTLVGCIGEKGDSKEEKNDSESNNDNALDDCEARGGTWTESEDKTGEFYCKENPQQGFGFEILSQHPFECMNSGTFDKFINVFGVYVTGSQGASLEYLNHTAHILAQLIDNDEDGVPDDSEVLSVLVDNNFIVPVWNTNDRENFWNNARGTYCEDNIGMAASMYYDEDAWALGGIESAGTWDTNLEEVWHVVSVGWYETYPDYMGTENENDEIISSNLTRALDAARGGHFESIPEQYPDDAWYTYDDDSCNYRCQAHEYFYWVLMANIGALDLSITNKCEESKNEWNVCTKDELEAVDVLGYDLFNNQDFNFPTIIPDGSYQSELNIVDNNTSDNSSVTYNVLYIGHSFGRPFADKMEDFSALAGINHNQTIEFSGGSSGAPDQLWADDEHRENIKSILETGSIDVLVMICCSQEWIENSGLSNDDAVWNFTSYALEQNPDTRIGLSMPWVDFPLEYDNATEHRNATDGAYPLWKNMASRLSSDFNGADVFTFYHGAAMYELREMFEEGNLSDVDQMKGASESSLFTDEKGHAGQIVKDTGTLLWLAAIHGVDPMSMPEFEQYETDIRLIAKSILDEQSQE